MIGLSIHCHQVLITRKGGPQYHEYHLEILLTMLILFRYQDCKENTSPPFSI